MAYPGVFYSDDGQILRAMQRAAANGGLIMMHAENGIAIDVLVAQALERGRDRPEVPRDVRHALLEAEATHRAIQLARVAGAPAVHRPCVGRRGRGRASPPPATRGSTSSPRPARSTCSFVDGQPRRAGLRGRRSTCARTPLRPSRAPGRDSGGACAPTTSGGRPPTTARSASRSRRSWAWATSPRSPTACRGVENRMDLLHQARRRRRTSRRRRWVEIALRPPRPGCSGSTRRRARSRPGADADIVIYDPDSRPDHVGRDPPHERRLLGLRGVAG